MPRAWRRKVRASRWRSCGWGHRCAPAATSSAWARTIARTQREFAASGFDQSAGAAEAVPNVPVVFTKTPETLIGHAAAIPRHQGVTGQMDYEAELAVVIGRGGRGIAREHAMEHVWGYTIANDVTARDLQKRHAQWFLGKSLDGFCPLGPWLTTADAFTPQDAAMRCWVNDELRQDANVNQMIFDIPGLIETISRGIALQPGDIILTGTPAGVGIGMSPPRFLGQGDHIRIEIEGLGVLSNRVEGGSSGPSSSVTGVRDV
ncbi:fumarylacetoacetate hydrolase family protein [Rhodanobacter lindaniclasticus]